MAEKKIDYKDLSRKEWTINETCKYPGFDAIQLGCLMRIADLADMLMHSQREAEGEVEDEVEDEVEMLRKLCDKERAANGYLRTTLSTVRGQLKRMKKKRAKAQKAGE